MQNKTTIHTLYLREKLAAQYLVPLMASSPEIMSSSTTKVISFSDGPVINEAKPFQDERFWCLKSISCKSVSMRRCLSATLVYTRQRLSKRSSRKDIVSRPHVQCCVRSLWPRRQALGEAQTKLSKCDRVRSGAGDSSTVKPTAPVNVISSCV